MSNWVAWARQQPWYAQVAPIMQAQGVPEYVWLSVVYDESSGTPTESIVDTNGKGSNGLFQINGDDTRWAQDPTKAANWAAPRLAYAVQQAGGPTAAPQTILRATEKVAWPGNDASLDASEFPTRWAKMQEVLQSTGQSNIIGNSTGPITQNANTVTAPVSSNGDANNPLNGAYWQQVSRGWNKASDVLNPTTINNTISGIEMNVFIGGIILALLAGAFVLIAA